MGEQPGMPLYPRPMSTLTDTTLGPPRWQRQRLTAATLCFLAALLTIVGSFLPLLAGIMTAGNETVDIEVTAWSADLYGISPIGGGTPDVPANGYPMVFAGIVLVGAALVCWFAAHPGAAAGAHRAAGLTTAIGGAFLAGTAWTVAVQMQQSLDSLADLNDLGPGDFGIATDVAFGVGFWFMVIGTLMAVTATVLALLPARQALWPVGPPPPVDPNMATPPFGFVLPTQPPPVQHQELSVDPLTGQPLHVDPFTGQPVGPYSPPAGTPLPSPPAGVPVPEPHYEPRPHPVQAPEPVPHGQNGTTAAEVPDIVLPAPPPPPVTPPGPAIPLTDDPLAEPRRD